MEERGRYKRFSLKFRQNALAVFAALVLSCLFVICMGAGIWAPHSPTEISLTNKFRPPSLQHPLGTDELGRDVFSRVLYGGRVSMMVGIGSMLVAVFVGSIVGAVAGFYGGLVDAVLMRITEGMLSIPVFFIIILAVAFLGSSMMNLILIIALTRWMMTARITRGEVLKYREADYVAAARSLGCSDLRILFSHIIPQAYSSIIVASTLTVAYAIVTEASLSYLGVGVQPPRPSWGNMLMNAQNYFWSSPLLVIYPGVLIFVTVLLLNALGDSLRESLDPTTG